MANSKFDELVSATRTELNDSSVLIAAGTTAKIQGFKDQKRRIIFERQTGIVKFSSGPAPKPVTTNVAKQTRFCRCEQIRITLTAEDEQLVDQLFDNLINAIFNVMGPNAFSESNRFEYGARDSKGGGYIVREPVIVFDLEVYFRVSPPAPLSAAILHTSYSTVLDNPEV